MASNFIDLHKKAKKELADRKYQNCYSNQMKMYFSLGLKKEDNMNKNRAEELRYE